VGPDCSQGDNNRNRRIVKGALQGFRYAADRAIAGDRWKKLDLTGPEESSNLGLEQVHDGLEQRARAVEDDRHARRIPLSGES